MLKKILYAEDDLDIQTIMLLSLDQDKYEILTCVSGDEAVEKAFKCIPDLIILDVMMPGLDGVAAFEELKSKNETKDIPVIFMTAKVGHQEIKSYYETGAIGVIQKPFDPEKLQSEIELIYSKHIASSSEESIKSIPRVLENYFDTLPEKIKTLENALSNFKENNTYHNINLLTNQIHNIYGSAQMYGLDKVSHYAGKLELNLNRLLIEQAVSHDDFNNIEDIFFNVIKSMRDEYDSYKLRSVKGEY